MCTSRRPPSASDQAVQKRQGGGKPHLGKGGCEAVRAPSHDGGHPCTQGQGDPPRARARACLGARPGRSDSLWKRLSGVTRRGSSARGRAVRGGAGRGGEGTERAFPSAGARREPTPAPAEPRGATGASAGSSPRRPRQLAAAGGRGFARRRPVCREPGICMKRLDPAEQRLQRRTRAAAAARSPSQAAPLSGPRWMRGLGGAHGPELRLPGASGRAARGAVEARRRRRRRKRRRSGTPGSGGGQRSAAAFAAAAPGSSCSWPRPWWSGNG